MRRNEPCAHLRPDYDRLEQAHYIKTDPETGEISWPPTKMEEELRRLGLISAYQLSGFAF
jgi:hypothetical protein